MADSDDEARSAFPEENNAQLRLQSAERGQR